MKTERNMVRIIGEFLKERLISQKRVSHHTIESYCYTFQLLLEFAASRLRKPASSLCVENFNDNLIGKFLDDLEKKRKMNPRSRNVRLAGIRSLFKYLSTKIPEEGIL